MIRGQKDERLGVRVSSEHLLVLEARAALCGLTLSDYVREMLEKSWGSRLAKAHRPYVGIAGILLEISPKLVNLSSRQNLSSYDVNQIEETLNKLNSVLDQIAERMALDQERELNADNEKETFE